MADLICRKTMMVCQTQGMCAPHGGCRVEQDPTVARLKALLASRDRYLRSLAADLNSAALKCMQHPYGTTLNNGLGQSFMVTVSEINNLLTEQP